MGIFDNEFTDKNKFVTISYKDTTKKIYVNPELSDDEIKVVLNVDMNKIEEENSI